MVDHPVYGRLGHSEECAELPHRQVGAPVRRDKQHLVLKRQRLRRPPVDVPPPLLHESDELAELSFISARRTVRSGPAPTP